MTRAADTVRSLSPSRRALAALLGLMRFGEVVVTWPDGSERLFRGTEPGPSARVEIRDPGLARRLITGGGVALAEGYMAGSWDTPDLDAVLDLGVANLGAGPRSRLPELPSPVRRLRHLLRDNDLTGARRNVEYHYDLGNAFYELWLDETMTYSSACFAQAGAPTLESAQRCKWDRMLELVQPRRGDHLLEIGCGWGGFAVHAAREAGCRVTALTLSREQAELARRRVEEQGLEDRVEVRLQDYRHVAGAYRGIVSIEMLEAVGERWWPTFFAKVKGLLEPGCAAGIQVITIPEERFEHYRRKPDFTQIHIFPGGMLPSPERFAAAAQAAGLAVGEPRFFGQDYARTLAEWARRFQTALPEVRALGFDERFIRMWRYYLSYCRAGFNAGSIDVMQTRLEA